ncbi:426_t:CDS:2, partial [Gigaspora rosea]
DNSTPFTRHFLIKIGILNNCQPLLVELMFFIECFVAFGVPVGVDFVACCDPMSSLQHEYTLQKLYADFSDLSFVSKIIKGSKPRCLGPDCFGIIAITYYLTTILLAIVMAV